MKQQNTLFALALTAVFALAGCEATSPVAEAPTQPEVVAPAATPAATPVAEVKPEHCDKNHQAAHDCKEHCAHAKGKKSKQCIKHCADPKAAAGHDCVKHCESHDASCVKHCADTSKHDCASHCAQGTHECGPAHCKDHHDHTAVAHECGASHCASHGGDMSKCCGDHK